LDAHAHGGSELINQATAGTHSATYAATADAKDDIKLEWTNATGDSQFMLEWQSTSQPVRSSPQDRLIPKSEDIKRFETHIAFTQRTTFDQFHSVGDVHLQRIVPGHRRQAGVFLDRRHDSSFDFTTRTSSKTLSNSIRGSLSRSLFNLPNRFVASAAI
jgi:hypothetical protein